MTLITPKADAAAPYPYIHVYNNIIYIYIMSECVF